MTRSLKNIRSEIKRLEKKKKEREDKEKFEKRKFNKRAKLERRLSELRDEKKPRKMGFREKVRERVRSKFSPKARKTFSNIADNITRASGRFSV